MGVWFTRYLSRPKGRPRPKPCGRTVVRLTITITPAQRAALEARADAEQVSISTVVRRFVAVGLAAGLCGLLFPLSRAPRSGRPSAGG